MPQQGAPFGNTAGNFVSNKKEQFTFWVYLFTTNQQATLLSTVSNTYALQASYQIDNGKFGCSLSSGTTRWDA